MIAARLVAVRSALPLAALRSSNYRLYWFGSLVAITGEQVRFIAQPYLVYELTGSPLQLGVVGLFSSLSTIALSFLGGALADRLDRRRVLLFTPATTGR